MARSQRILVLNLGMQTVKLAVFRGSPEGGLTLEAIESEELISDPAADATRPAQIAAAVSGLKEKLKLKRKEEVTVILPSQAVFSRFVRLPGAAATDVEQIIPFEAQQNVPFPIDEVVWDHQILSEKHEDSWDVVLVAIKSDQLTEIVDAVEEGGLQPGTVGASPAALYNAFRYNYPDKEGCSLLIDIGARTSNLIFIEKDRFFSRPVPIGGSAITAAVAKELQQDVTLAEKLKIEKGFVGLGGAYAEPEDPTEAKIAKLIRSSLTRLHAEISRSIAFYRQTHHGSAPSRVYLAGGSASLGYITEFFSEKLQVPVEHFHALGNVMVASDAVAGAVAGRSYLLGDLVGGALRSLGNCPVEINLRPPKLVAARQLARRFPLLATAAACLVLALASWAAFFWQASAITREQLASVEAEVNQLDRISKKIGATIKETTGMKDSAAPLLLVTEERAAWIALLDELGKNLPARFIWVTSLEPVSGGQVIDLSSMETAPTAPRPRTPRTPRGAKQADVAEESPKIDALRLSGLYLANPPNRDEARIIDQFVENLSQSPLFRIESKSGVVTQRTTADGTRWAYSYSLELPLANPISLP